MRYKPYNWSALYLVLILETSTKYTSYPTIPTKLRWNIDEKNEISELTPDPPPLGQINSLQLISRQALSYDIRWIANIGIDTAENEPPNILGTVTHTQALRSAITLIHPAIREKQLVFICI